MAMFGGYKHGFLIWIAHFLAFCGFGVLIGGLAALQARCNDIPGANPTSYFVHYMPYNTSCHKYFRYTWWITFFQLFVWGAVAFHLFSRTIHKFRVGLIGFLAVVTVLLMDTANTYLWYTSAPSVADSLFIKRTKVVFAGAIISAIANMLQIWLMGYHDEKASWEERTGNYNKGYGYGETHTTTTAAPGTTPVATNVQSTTTAAVV